MRMITRHAPRVASDGGLRSAKVEPVPQGLQLLSLSTTPSGGRGAQGSEHKFMRYRTNNTTRLHGARDALIDSPRVTHASRAVLPTRRFLTAAIVYLKCISRITLARRRCRWVLAWLRQLFAEYPADPVTSSVAHLRENMAAAQLERVLWKCWRHSTALRYD